MPLKDTKGRRILADHEHTEMAARAEEREIAKAERGDIAIQKRSAGRLPLSKAADDYLASRRGEISETSRRKETDLTVSLKKHFGLMRLSKITAERLHAFRECRTAAGVGPTFINMEVGCLRRILKKAGLWHLIGDGIKPLREPETIGRALTHDERIRLFRTAAQKPEWETAYLAAVVAVNTTARKCELRALEWRHVDFINRMIEIPKSKTEAGVRVLPLNTESYEALWKLRRRAEMFGPVQTSHFVFGALRPKFHWNGNTGSA